ncbi:MAG: DNA-directed RNA polymerase subunit alpha [Candidatus Berkelbacteria bacterium]
MEKIGLPKIKEEKISANCSRFIVEPLFPGYGATIGNSLRRALLSSIRGAAATSYKIEGVSHEFTSIPHAKEDAIELMMNLKNIHFKSFSEEPVTIELSKKGPGEVTAADFKKNSNIEISNPDQHIITLDAKADLNMEVTVERGRGFEQVTAESKKKSMIGQIMVDANFSPVERVVMSTEDTRVGQMTNYDRLVLEVTTNGTVDPLTALKESGKILVEHYQAIINDENFIEQLTEVKIEESPIVAADEIGTEIDTTLEAEISSDLDGKTKIEESGLSQRTANALINSGIKTVAGLNRLSDLKLEEVKGLGKKGIDEIKMMMGR